MIRIPIVLNVVFLVLQSFAVGMETSSTSWMWREREAKTFRVSTTFHVHDAETVFAKVAVDFCETRVELNGKEIGIVGAERSMREFDCWPLIDLRGANELVLSSVGQSGPSAIAVQLFSRDKSGKMTELAHDGWNHRGEGELTFYGDVKKEPWWNTDRLPKVDSFDEYNQWEDAKQGYRPKEFQIVPGFRLESVFQVPRESGSWICMKFDPMGRLIVGTEKNGVQRLTFGRDENAAKLEKIAELDGVQGIHVSEQGLLVNSNASQGVFHLVTEGSGYGEPKLVQATPGGRGDHSRHDIVSHEGSYYSIHGDSIGIGDSTGSDVPTTQEFQGGHPEAGHVLQFNQETDAASVFCAGLRNPYGMAMGPDADLFTFDADAERHTGLPWYRPTRILHLVKGGDYGWRSPGRPWASYLPDSLPAAVNIGRGSPTSLVFGEATDFPPKYQRSLFALDWSYGRILAVQLVPNGASYHAHAEEFARGRPFNVCDIEVGPDKSLYVLTGGRGTKSAVYRIRYVDQRTDQELVPTKQIVDREEFSRRKRTLRRSLEARFHSPDDEAAIELAWDFLGDPDPFIAHAARTILEHRPVSQWRTRLFDERDSFKRLPALLALTRVSNPSGYSRIVQELASVDLRDLSRRQLLTAIRTIAWIDHYGDLSAQQQTLVNRQFEPLFPSTYSTVNRELCALLARTNSEKIVQRTLQHLSRPHNQIDRFHLLMSLSTVASGWNEETRGMYFAMLRHAKQFQTDEGMHSVLDSIVQEAIEHVPASRRESYQALFQANGTNETANLVSPRDPVRKWTVEELTAELRDMSGGSVERGRSVFVEATCAKCHRKGALGSFIGPDLSTVAARFSREHLLREIVDPSANISSQFRDHVIELNDGKTIVGRVIWNGFRQSKLHIAVDPTKPQDYTAVKKNMIESHYESTISPMPSRLLDGFSAHEIADLIAFLEAGER